MSTAALFPQDSRKRFIEITGKRYDSMKTRLARKKLFLPFSKEQLRSHLLYKFMGGSFDGAIQCRYCLRVIDISECALDHGVPLIRGGSPDLDNIEPPCAACNDQKGEMLPAEFHALLHFLQREIPFARTSVLKRLQEHGKLLAGKRMNEFAIRQLKESGQWPKKPKALPPPMQKVIDSNF